MPYEVKKKGSKWHVVNSDTGEDKGESETYELAVAHMRAMYAHEDDSRAYEEYPRRRR
jgi:hypothetical protein